MLTAAGVSETVVNHLTKADRLGAIQGLIDNFLEPSGDSFIDELVYRFLLIRGDALDDSMRNLAGALGERKFTRAILSILKLESIKYSWLHSKTRNWINQSVDDADIELSLKDICWKHAENQRTMIFNLIESDKKEPRLIFHLSQFEDQ